MRLQLHRKFCPNFDTSKIYKIHVHFYYKQLSLQRYSKYLPTTTYFMLKCFLHCNNMTNIYKWWYLCFCLETYFYLEGNYTYDWSWINMFGYQFACKFMTPYATDNWTICGKSVYISEDHLHSLATKMTLKLWNGMSFFDFAHIVHHKTQSSLIVPTLFKSRILALTKSCTNYLRTKEATQENMGNRPHVSTEDS